MKYVCNKCGSPVSTKWIELPSGGTMGPHGEYIPFLCTNKACEYSMPGYPKLHEWVKEA